MPGWRIVVLASCLVGSIPRAIAQPPSTSLIRGVSAAAPAARGAAGRARSTGLPWDGRLVTGARLRESRHVRYLPEVARSRNFFGTLALVQLLERAARGVAARWPGRKLTVGELSSERGGDIGGHNSHESGRDADVAFFTTWADGRPHDGISFAAFDAAGRGLAPNGGLRFDDARNWELVARLISDEQARVQYIFVARTLRARLLREAVRRRVSPVLLERAKTVLVEPARGNPHRSHFHVRIYCQPADRPECQDEGPFWAWYPGTAPRSAQGAHAQLADHGDPPNRLSQRNLPRPARGAGLETRAQSARRD